jgi:hypothetical protein
VGAFGAAQQVREAKPAAAVPAGQAGLGRRVNTEECQEPLPGSRRGRCHRGRASAASKFRGASRSVLLF